MDYLGGPHLNTQVFKSRGSCIVEASESQSHVTGGESDECGAQRGVFTSTQDGLREERTFEIPPSFPPFHNSLLPAVC